MLFGIATSLEMFQEKVPQAMARHLQGVRFDLAHLNIEDVFKTATHSNTVGCLWVGPGLTKVMIQRHKDYIQCASTFTQALKVTPLFMMIRSLRLRFSSIFT